jgi:hypothetical protein
VLDQANSIVQGGKLTELVDPSLPTENGNTGEVERMILAAALCITRAPQQRPSMANVRRFNIWLFFLENFA